MDFGFGILFFVKGSDLAEDMRRPLRLGVDFDYFILLVIGDISLSLSLSAFPVAVLETVSLCKTVPVFYWGLFRQGHVATDPVWHKSSCHR